MASSTTTSDRLQLMQSQLMGQFQGLDPKNPAAWPAVPKMALYFLTATLVVVVLWFLWLSASQEELTKAVDREAALKADYKTKLTKAVNLDILKKQREQVQQYVTQLEKQLPSKAEMDALLSDINQAGLGRSLQFELFRPGQISVQKYYAELPITLRVTGRYHDIGAFASDVANLSRIVTLNNLTIAPKQDGTLTLDSTAKTFRYLDADEVLAQSKATAGAKK